MMAGSFLHRLKYLFAIAISLAFTVAGIFFATKVTWFHSIFFGICCALFIYMFLDPRREKIPYDEMFLSRDDVEAVEYYDWGFYHYAQKLEFYWDRIHAITAFKRDLITTDEIYLSIEHEFDVLIISGSSPEWERLKDEITNRFAPEDTGWFEKLAGDAMGDDEIILYKKQMANKSFT